jgi:hypothetical protein
MAPLDGGDMLTAFRRAKEYALGKRRQTLSALIDEINVSVQYNMAYIKLAPQLTRPEKEGLVDELNDRLGGPYAYMDTTINRILVEIKPAMLVRLNKYAAANRISRQEAIIELVELGLAHAERA